MARYLIAIDATSGGAYRELPKAHHDFNTIVNRLTSDADGEAMYARALENEIKEVLHENGDPDDAPHALTKAIRTWKGPAGVQLSSKDTVCLFFEGHGVIAGNRDVYLVLPRSVKTRGNLDTHTALRTRELLTSIFEGEHCPGEILMILQCCSAGSAAKQVIEGIFADGFVDALPLRRVDVIAATMESVGKAEHHAGTFGEHFTAALDDSSLATADTEFISPAELCGRMEQLGAKGCTPSDLPPKSVPLGNSRI